MNKLVLATLLLASSTTINAAIVDHADVNGLRTFQDTNTGYIWLDIDNFFDKTTGISTYTGNDMITAAQNAGFTFASKTDALNLRDTLTLTNGEFSNYTTIIGYGPFNGNPVIWGMYDDGNAAITTYGETYTFGVNWVTNDNIVEPTSISNTARPGDQSMGIWAFRTSAPTAAVPEPETYAMFLAGLGLMGFAARRRKA